MEMESLIAAQLMFTSLPRISQVGMATATLCDDQLRSVWAKLSHSEGTIPKMRTSSIQVTNEANRARAQVTFWFRTQTKKAPTTSIWEGAKEARWRRPFV